MKLASKQNYVQHFTGMLIILTVNIILAVTIIFYNNSQRSVPILLFLFTLGTAILITRGKTQGSILGLLVVSSSIVIKQYIGAWLSDNLAFNLLEVILMATTFILAGYYHDALGGYFNELEDAKRKLRILDMEDTSVGLIRTEIGLLRLKEEVDRAIRFERPISLVLILALPSPDAEWDSGKRLLIMRAIATAIKSTTRSFDIPFLLEDNKIALILTNTEINGTKRVINNIQDQIYNSRIITQTGFSESIRQHARVRIGFGAFLGYNNMPFDLMEEAETSLTQNIEMNLGGIFQNMFIE